MQGRSIATTACALLVACTLLPALSSTGQVLQIHPRVGSELDDGERRYFNLFRQWPEGTVRATDAVLDGIRFFHSESPELSLIAPDTALVSLGVYLDRFETLEPGQDSLDWASLNGIARYAKRYFPQRPYTFTSLSGDQKTATILYVDDDDLWVSEDASFDWRNMDRSVLRVDATGIARMTRRRHGLAILYRSAIAIAATVLPWQHSLRSAGKYDIGRYVGAGGTALAAGRWAMLPRRHSIAGRPWRFDLALLRIERKEAFPSDFLAPELRVRIGQPGRTLFENDDRSPVTWQPAWTIAFSYAWLNLPTERSGYYATGFGLPDFEAASTDWTHVEIGRDLNERFSLSVEGRFALDPDTGEPVMDYSGLLVAALAEWHPWRPELHSFTRRFWVSVGAGPSIARLVSGTVVEWTPQITFLEPSLEGPQDFVQKATLAALQVRGRASWAVTRRLSVTARASAWLPPFHVEDDREFTVGRVTYYDLDGFSLAYGVSFGVVHELGRK